MNMPVINLKNKLNIFAFIHAIFIQSITHPIQCLILITGISKGYTSSRKYERGKFSHKKLLKC